MTWGNKILPFSGLGAGSRRRNEGKRPRGSEEAGEQRSSESESTDSAAGPPGCSSWLHPRLQGSVILRESFNLPVPQFPHLLDVNDNSTSSS